MKELVGAQLQNGDVMVIDSLIITSRRYYVVMENIGGNKIVGVCIKDSESDIHNGHIVIPSYDCPLSDCTVAVYRPLSIGYMLSTDYTNTKCFKQLKLSYRAPNKNI